MWLRLLHRLLHLGLPLNTSQVGEVSPPSLFERDGNRLEKFCAPTGAATIKKVVHTWKDLVRFMDHMGLRIPDAHALATFAREHQGPTLIYTSLGWMIRNLRVLCTCQKRPKLLRSGGLGLPRASPRPQHWGWA